MNQELWNEILAFDLDNPPSEYGFSVRLAKEYYWTQDFTQQAIVEYKKFMYLAATSDFMVSPSEIVDCVWHQHLIFTQSYQDFCLLLGKQIQHIPSTHNKDDFDKFRQAKARTLKFYERDFGAQPKSIWAYNDMFESLNLGKAQMKLRTFIIVGILAFICLTVPAYFLLKPVYVQINNPYFVIGFIVLSLVTLLLLELYNRRKLKNIVTEFDKDSFIFHLQPFELVYLKTQNLGNVINGTVNELVDNGTIVVQNKKLELAESNNETTNIAQLQVITILADLGTTSYDRFFSSLVSKPVFGNVSNSMDAFLKYFNKSKKFGNLFYTNFIVLASLLLFSFTRIVTGILRDKPIYLIVLFTVIIVIVMIMFLKNLTKQIATTIIPNFYKNNILSTTQIENNWQWRYFLSGTAVLTTSFAPLVTTVVQNNSGGNCTSSCNSGGSSCSSCGGCGGGGD
ncbi:hypothetical protein SAMN05421780_11610 [Flexibacter flexilis DSM 6793]|uniref:TIGR04222 domain-containing protein n=1 Tax=Flexibacter flexilis DSM 6793 TaxID=927664 RepID=A0A1I1NK15_9BACT|nr:hypothetical protein [Flexibacter flexilis]SFC98034.1 hypothetical protein SAMN05421780_11610 [Flexibacter flexilis DSM 6793]